MQGTAIRPGQPRRLGAENGERLIGKPHLLDEGVEDEQGGDRVEQGIVPGALWDDARNGTGELQSFGNRR